MRPSTAGLSREEAKLITRHRLMQAGLAVLAEEGFEGLTTGRVAKRAGVAQPTFYVHFKDMDELLRAIAEDQVGRLRTALRELRQQLRQGNSNPMEIVRETYRLPLRVITEQYGGTLRLFISELYRPKSPLGHYARNTFQEICQDLVDDISAFGLGAHCPPEKLSLICEGLIALTAHYGIALLEGRRNDLEAVVDLLSQMTITLLFNATQSPR